MSIERPSPEQPNLENEIASAQQGVERQEAISGEQEGAQGSAKAGEKKENFDVEKGKQEYAELHLAYLKSMAEHDSLSNEQLKAADALIANPQDADAKLRYWEIVGQLDKAREQGEKLGDQQSELVGKLLEGENGAQNLKAAKAIFRGKIEGSMKEDPNLAEYLVPGGLERMKESQKRMEKLAELRQRLGELQEKNAEMNERFNALKQEDEKLANETRALLKSGKEKDMEELKNNTNMRRDLAKQIKSMEVEYKKLNASYDELEAEYLNLS